MKFSAREICDVVLRAKSAQKIGNKVFYKNEPVIYFDSLKTSSLEGQATTVYAQGGRGNVRLIAWEGERTVTFVMEDALISPEGISILTGAGLVKAEEKSIIVHKTEVTDEVKRVIINNELNHIEIKLKEEPYKIPSNRAANSKEDFIYVMLLDEKGEVISEPYIASEKFKTGTETTVINLVEDEDSSYVSDDFWRKNDLSKFIDGCQVLVDYYVEKKDNAFQINITPDKFSGNFYLEASTLFRTTDGQDLPAEFIIPNCKIQSNFNFTMASSGDPTTFTFTMDAFPDYTRWNKNKKVFASIQVIEQNEALSNLERLGTPHDHKSSHGFEPYLTYANEQAEYIEEEPPVKVINMIYDSVNDDENESIYNNGLGYKLDTVIAEETGNVVLDHENYIVTGFIPYNSQQNIYITGFNIVPETNDGQGIYFYDENKNYIGYKTYNINEIVGCSLTNESIKYIRICFYNTNIQDLAVIVCDSDIGIEIESLSGTRSLPIEEDNSLVDDENE